MRRHCFRPEDSAAAWFFSVRSSGLWRFYPAFFCRSFFRFCPFLLAALEYSRSFHIFVCNRPSVLQGKVRRVWHRVSHYSADLRCLYGFYLRRRVYLPGFLYSPGLCGHGGSQGVFAPHAGEDGFRGRSFVPRNSPCGCVCLRSCLRQKVLPPHARTGFSRLCNVKFPAARRHPVRWQG